VVLNAIGFNKNNVPLFSHSRKEDPSVPIANRASSPIMGAFLGVFWQLAQKKASTGRGGVPNWVGGVSFITKRALFCEKKKTASIQEQTVVFARRMLKSPCIGIRRGTCKQSTLILNPIPFCILNARFEWAKVPMSNNI
jgi:hypothetical protein